ncbi:MAG: hypothetical protein ABI748_10055 [Dokdonella sp.]
MLMFERSEPRRVAAVPIPAIVSIPTRSDMLDDIAMIDLDGAAVRDLAVIWRAGPALCAVA